MKGHEDQLLRIRVTFYTFTLFYLRVRTEELRDSGNPPFHCYVIFMCVHKIYERKWSTMYGTLP